MVLATISILFSVYLMFVGSVRPFQTRTVTSKLPFYPDGTVVRYTEEGVRRGWGDRLLHPGTPQVLSPGTSVRVGWVGPLNCRITVDGREGQTPTEMLRARSK